MISLALVNSHKRIICNDPTKLRFENQKDTKSKKQAL